MNEITISGNIRNIRAAGGSGVSFEISREDGAPLCVMEGTKAAVFYSLLMEGDPVSVTGSMAERDGTPYVKVTGLDVLPNR